MVRCILETPETHGYGVDFCRVPVDCDICSDVNIYALLSLSCKNQTIFTLLMDGSGVQVREIEEVHVSDLSVELFEERYAYTHRPLVVRNASIFWEALQVTIKMQPETNVVLEVGWDG